MKSRTIVRGIVQFSSPVQVLEYSSTEYSSTMVQYSTGTARGVLHSHLVHIYIREYIYMHICYLRTSTNVLLLVLAEGLLYSICLCNSQYLVPWYKHCTEHICPKIESVQYLNLVTWYRQATYLYFVSTFFPPLFWCHHRIFGKIKIADIPFIPLASRLLWSVELPAFCYLPLDVDYITHSISRLIHFAV